MLSSVILLKQLSAVVMQSLFSLFSNLIKVGNSSGHDFRPLMVTSCVEITPEAFRIDSTGSSNACNTQERTYSFSSAGLSLKQLFRLDFKVKPAIRRTLVFKLALSPNVKIKEMYRKNSGFCFASSSIYPRVTRSFSYVVRIVYILIAHPITKR